MMVRTLSSIILIFTISFIVIIIISPISSLTIISDIIHSHSILGFLPTNPSSQNNTTINHPPVANAGVNQTVNETDSVTLNGIASDPDPNDNDKLTYLWTQTTGPYTNLKNSNTTNPSFIAPTVSSDRVLKFLLIARDDKGATSNNTAIVAITVRHVNHPPIANVGQVNQVANPGDIATLDGSKSKDPDNGDTLSYSWVQISGPRVKMDGANTSIATFTTPSNISADTPLVFKLIVKDSKNATSIADAKVIDKYTPPPNRPPIANIAVNTSMVHGVKKVTLNGSGSRDQDGIITSYSWNQTAGPVVSLFGANTSTATFTAPKVSPAIMEFLLTVKDNKGATSNSTRMVITR